MKLSNLLNAIRPAKHQPKQINPIVFTNLKTRNAHFKKQRNTIYVGHRKHLENKKWTREDFHEFSPERDHSRGNLLDVSIPGMGKLFDPKYGFIGKAFWAFAILSCTAVCISQLAIRVSYYFSYPLFIDTTVRRLQTINFPSVTLCPARHPVSLPMKSEENLTLADMGTTLQQLWQQYQIHENIVEVTTSCVVTYDPNCESDGIVQVDLSLDSIKTLWGTCTILTAKSHVIYRGAYTYMDFQLHNVHKAINIEEGAAVVQYFLHSKELRQKHDAFFLADYVFEDSYTTARLGVKEFNLLNTKKEPCVDPVEAVTCRNKCIDHMMERSMNCSLPFMEKTTLSPCTTMYDAYIAYKQAQRVYTTLDPDACVCRRACKEVVYSMSVDIEFNRSHNLTTISLFYAQNLLEVVNEYYAYPFSALLSDIGGNLGFFLGICVLTIVEVVEGLIGEGRIILAKVCRHRQQKMGRRRH